MQSKITTIVTLPCLFFLRATYGQMTSSAEIKQQREVVKLRSSNTDFISDDVWKGRLRQNVFESELASDRAGAISANFQVMSIDFSQPQFRLISSNWDSPYKSCIRYDIGFNKWIPDTNGLLVSVSDQSDCDLHPGDKVATINGERVDQDNLEELLAGLKADDNVTLEFARWDDAHILAGHVCQSKLKLGKANVVVDRSTNLMWARDETPVRIRLAEYVSPTLHQINEWLTYFNANRLYGYSDWRLPTLDEAASLLQKETTRHQRADLHLASEFDGFPPILVTGDSVAGVPLCVNYIQGHILTSTPWSPELKGKWGVRFVRDVTNP